ncbi:MAG TPA: zf-TFIIB domain-containing protein [Candidatus Binataceae bacterium]
MADSEKDRLGDKFHDVEAAREEQWARKRDQELLAKMRVKGKSELLCPECSEQLVPKAEHGVKMHACPGEHGFWLDVLTLNKLVNPKK